MSVFDHKKYLVDVASLKKLKEIGGGSFGTVFTGKWNGDGGGIDIAIKKIKLQRRFKPERHLREFKIMFESQFPLVLQAFGYALEKDQKTLYIVMELMEEDLFNYIDRKDLKPEEQVSPMIKLTQCLHFLHSRNPRIIHRDVKSMNYLLSNGGGVVKITDFGIAKSKFSTFASSAGGKGTFLWMAPELFQSGKVLYTRKSDVYALAMTFFEVLNREPPFFKEMEEDIINPTVPSSIYGFIKDGKRPECLETVPKELVSFLGRCWRNDPKERMSTQEIIEWLTEYGKGLRLERERNDGSASGSNEDPGPDLVDEDAKKKVEIEKEAGEREEKEKEEKEAKEKKEKEVREKKEKEAREREKEEKEKEAREKESREKEIKEKEVREREKKELTVSRESKVSSVTVPRGFKSKRGILVPQDVVFEVNKKYRSLLKKVFSKGNKVAKGYDDWTITCFKTSAVFTAGKKFYFQVSANVGSGFRMGFGILSGEITKRFVGYHEKGWSYHCYKGNPPKLTYHNSQFSSGYGPERTTGKHTFGIFCDYTNGKGEVSFIVDGKNWGVAYKNVKPPVSPAFYVYMRADSFKIEDTFEVPDCL